MSDGRDVLIRIESILTDMTLGVRPPVADLRQVITDARAEIFDLRSRLSECIKVDAELADLVDRLSKAVYPRK